MFSSDDLWVYITVAAAVFQCIRTALQKRMTADLSANANTLARYLYGLPFVLIYLGAVLGATGQGLPAFNTAFAVNLVVGGLAQIAATALMIMAFTDRGYAVGVTLSKTEAVQAALFGAVLLGEHVTGPEFIAIVVSAAGIMSLTWPASGARFRLDRSAVYGLLSGTFFAVTAVGIRGANLALGVDFITAAATTLATMVCFQTVTLAAYLAWRARDQLIAVLRRWRPALLVGLFSALGSMGWFTGMALEKAAYVRTLGQIELVFTVLASRFYFRERLTRREAAGLALVAGGLVVLVALG